MSLWHKSVLHSKVIDKVVTNLNKHSHDCFDGLVINILTKF